MTSSLRVLAAFLRRDGRIALAYPLPFAFDMLGAAFILVLLYEVGRFVRIPPGAPPALAHGYFAYVLVGMAVLQLVTTVMQSFAQQLREEQTTGTLESLLATPTSPTTIILGSAVYDLVRPLVLCLVMLSLGAVLGIHYTLGVSSVAAVVALGGVVVLFASLGIGVAAFTVVYKRGGSLSGLVAAGLGLVGGVYYPTTQLPSGVRQLGASLPFTWGVDALRDGLIFGRVDGAKLLGLTVAAALSIGCALELFRRAVRSARRRGTLSHY